MRKRRHSKTENTAGKKKKKKHKEEIKMSVANKGAWISSQ